MTRPLGKTLPEHLRAVFSGDNIEEREGLTFLVLTSTGDGWPHLAMFSVGEIVVVGPDTLYLAAWPQSTATQNLRRSEQVTLALVWQAAGYYIRCRARQGENLHVGRGGDLAFFELTVDEVLEDIAPYAVLTSGVTFELKDRSDVLPRWQETVTALKRRAQDAHAVSGGT